MKTKNNTYLCPLCSKQTAYIAQYGLPDSVICKCKGLNEVGRIVDGKYIPNYSPPNKITSSKLESENFTYKQLLSLQEIMDMGRIFSNALRDPIPAQRYMDSGKIYVATHKKDATKNIIFLVNNNKKLENFYLAHNRTPEQQDRNEVVKFLFENNITN